MKHRLTALAIASLLTLTACGGSHDSDDSGKEAAKPSDTEAVDVVHEAVDATLGVTSMEVDSEARLEVTGTEVVFGIDGEFDYESKVGEAEFGIEQAGQSQQVEIRSDGESAWFRVEGDSVPAVPDGKTWAQGDVAALSTNGSMEPEGLVGVVIALRGAEEVEVGESKEIDGEPAREFTTTVVYGDALEAAGDDREAFESAFSLTGVDDAELDITVWIGDDGVIRDFDLSVDSGGKPIDGSYALEIGNVNDEVESPEAPDPDDVATGPEAEAWIAQMSTAEPARRDSYGCSGRYGERSVRSPLASSRPSASARSKLSSPVARSIQVRGSVSTTAGGVPRVCRTPGTTWTAAYGGTRTSTDLPGARCSSTARKCLVSSLRSERSALPLRTRSSAAPTTAGA